MILHSDSEYTLESLYLDTYPEIVTLYLTKLLEIIHVIDDLHQTTSFRGVSEEKFGVVKFHF